jgi:dTDP-4-amino-4,6-dideoxygalactose transaminase|tara:strand:- start:601 stop:969 length:369 start_codon:yes stop_codon:yes gene_type:complete
MEFFTALAQGEASLSSFSPTTIITVLGGVVVTMAGTVAGIAKLFHNTVKKDKEEVAAKLDLCQTEHKAKDIWALDIQGRMGNLEGMMEGHKQARTDMKGLSNSILTKLDDIHSHIKGEDTDN